MAAKGVLANGIKHWVARGVEPVSERWVDTMLCVALALWTFGQICMAHSTIAGLPLVAGAHLDKIHQAIVAGCLVAALACREYEFEPLELVLLGLALFATVSVWRANGDAHLIVLLLFAVTAAGMDPHRLARWYVGGALAGLVMVLVMQSVGASALVATLQWPHYVSAYGFSELYHLPYLLFSVLVGIVLGTEDSGSWFDVAVSVVCVLAAAILYVTLHAVRVSASLVLFGGFIVLRPYRPRLVHEVMSHKGARWFVVLLPLVLFCLASDGSKFYGLTMFKGGYSRLIKSYGYGSLICMYVLYARGVLRLKATRTDQVLLVACALFALLLTAERLPLYMEFDCALPMVLCRAGAAMGCGTDALPRGRHAAPLRDSELANGR